MWATHRFDGATDPDDRRLRVRNARAIDECNAQSALCRARAHVHARIAEPVPVAGKRFARSIGRRFRGARGRLADAASEAGPEAVSDSGRRMRLQDAERQKRPCSRWRQKWRQKRPIAAAKRRRVPPTGAASDADPRRDPQRPRALRLAGSTRRRRPPRPSDPGRCMAAAEEALSGAVRPRTEAAQAAHPDRHPGTRAGRVLEAGAVRVLPPLHRQHRVPAGGRARRAPPRPRRPAGRRDQRRAPARRGRRAGAAPRPPRGAPRPRGPATQPRG